MQAVDHIAIMQNTIAYMRGLLIFPPAQEINNPGFKFYLRVCMLSFSTYMFPIGGMLHIIVNCTRNTYTNLSSDLSSVLTTTGSHIYHIIYLLNLKNTLKIYRMLSDFQTFGKPNNFDHWNLRLNKLSYVHSVVSRCANIGIVLSPWLVYNRCYAGHIGRDIEEICGMVVPTWLPFNLMGTVFKYVFYGYQVYSAYTAYSISTVINFTLVEIIEHIKIRFQHVSTKFFEALREKDPVLQRKKFNNAVEYHVAIRDLVNMVNTSFNALIFVFALLTGAVMGCAGHEILEDFSFHTLSVMMTWSAVVVMTCTCGQRLMDEGTTLAEAIYNLDWIGADKQIQKDIVIVLLGCQMPITIEARPLGSLNFSMIVVILNTTYTYLTFLNRTK